MDLPIQMTSTTPPSSRGSTTDIDEPDCDCLFNDRGATYRVVRASTDFVPDNSVANFDGSGYVVKQTTPAHRIAKGRVQCMKCFTIVESTWDGERAEPGGMLGCSCKSICVDWSGTCGLPLSFRIMSENGAVYREISEYGPPHEEGCKYRRKK